MKKSLIILAFLLSVFYTHGQSVQWTSFENLNDSLKTGKKSLLVFIYTDWCKYCKIQENTTFRDSNLIRRLNENYYCLRLNAEDKRDISFLNRTYPFHTSKGYNALAELLGSENGRLSFPTTVLIDENLDLFERLQGFQSAEYLLQMIRVNNIEKTQISKPSL